MTLLLCLLAFLAGVLAAAAVIALVAASAHVKANAEHRPSEGPRYTQGRP